jgi:hypothetical protein
VKVWLVVYIIIAGHDDTVKLEDTEQPTIEMCLTEARHILDKTSDMHGTFELSVACQVTKVESDPL